MIALEVRNLTRQFELGALPAVYDASFAIKKGEILAMVGPSGCGKTTTLRLIAGFEQPDAGSVILAGQVIADPRRSVPTEQRGIGMVFQEHALFPHLTVFENVAFGLKRQPRRAAEDRTKAMLDLIGLGRLSHRYPYEISGGERQRVALARALAPQPIVLLLDEPFSSLDADLRKQIREEVRLILKEIGATAIFVTHDQEEALFMGDRLAVFDQGRLEQLGTPEEIFHCPATRFVAEFMGQTDFLMGQVTPAGIMTEIGLLEQRTDLPTGTRVEVAFRADDVTLEAETGAHACVLTRQFKGALNIYRLQLDSGQILHAFQPHTQNLSPGDLVRVQADPGHPLACFYNGKATGPCKISAENLTPAKRFSTIP